MNEITTNDPLISFWQRWASGILATLLCATIIGGFAWAVNMDNQMNKLTFAMDAVTKSLSNQHHPVTLGAMNSLEKRVMLLEYRQANPSARIP